MTELPKHSPIGASGMKRWKNCPGSVRLSYGIEKKASVHADEGTTGHEMAEFILRSKEKGDHKKLNLHKWFSDNAKIKDDNYDVDEMISFVHVYVDHVLSLKRPGSIQLYEHKFHLKDIHPDLFGTADCVTYYPDQKLLIISDLKYGSGVFVDVERNDQLMYYALGAVLTLNLAVHKVRIEIIQPRINSAEAIRPWECDIFELLEFAEDLRGYAERTRDPNAPLAAGDWCRWCPAAGICPLLREKSRELATKVFSPIKQDEVDYDELADVLDWLPILENWITSTREFAYNRAMAGKKIPRHKLVPKRANRVWKDEEDVIKTLKKKFAIGHDDMVVVKESLMSPSQMEKVLIKKVKNKTKFKEVLFDLYDKKSSGFSLVHESDDRDEASQVDPKSVFSSSRSQIDELN